MSSPSRLIVRRYLLLLALGTTIVLPLVGATPNAGSANGAGTVNFAEQVWPIIESSCLQCHDKATAYSNLRLDSPERILKGGDLGVVLVAGEPDMSPLVTRVTLPQDDLDFMPLEGEPLDEEQIELLTQWIQEGADFGTWTGVEQ